MDNTETYSGVPLIGQNEPAKKPPMPSTSQSPPVEIDDSKATAHYSNFCRLSALPEELLIDFGLNPQPVGTPTHSIAVTQRIVTGWHTAKRLVQVLQMTVDRHEAAFGVLETDVHKRVRRT
jgi:hypothetical protein